MGPPTVAIGGLTALALQMGIKPELLIAGFSGSIVAIALLNTVPSSGDTWQHMLKTSLRRVSVSVASALCSAYCAPLVPLSADPHLLGAGFVVGAGAQTILAALIQRFAGKGPESSP